MLALSRACVEWLKPPSSQTLIARMIELRRASDHELSSRPAQEWSDEERNNAPEGLIVRLTNHYLHMLHAGFSEWAALSSVAHPGSRRHRTSRYPLPRLLAIGC